VTSKTAAEVAHLLVLLDLPGPAGFENGAGVIDRGGRISESPRAASIDRLRHVADGLRRVTGAPLRTLDELSDPELGVLTCLTGEDLARACRRRATLPLVVDDEWDTTLSGAAPPDLLLVRGDRFLHLQGRHSKADVVPDLLAAAPGDGVVVVCGDAPNDLELLRAGDLAVIIPSTRGAHRELSAALPDAVIAPAPHGRGWAMVVTRLLEAQGG
jgi:mannosyl-3-phosphoglycerate phosphatase